MGFPTDGGQSTAGALQRYNRKTKLKIICKRPIPGVNFAEWVRQQELISATPGEVGDGQTKKLEFKLESGKCQHFYFYHLHPEFGLMHLRLQSWFPFQVQICINGREWLSRQMDRYQMNYAQKENCFMLYLDQSSQRSSTFDGQATSD